MFTAALFLRAKMWKQSKCPSAVVYAYNVTVCNKSNDSLMYTKTQMNPENMLNARSLSQKTTDYMKCPEHANLLRIIK